MEKVAPKNDFDSFFIQNSTKRKSFRTYANAALKYIWIELQRHEQLKCWTWKNSHYFMLIGMLVLDAMEKIEYENCVTGPDCVCVCTTMRFASFYHTIQQIDASDKWMSLPHLGAIQTVAISRENNATIFRVFQNTWWNECFHVAFQFGVIISIDFADSKTIHDDRVENWRKNHINSVPSAISFFSI